MNQVVANFKKYRFLLKELIKKDIKLKYRNSVLGMIWTLLEPLLTMIVLTLVFTTMLGKDVENYPVYILSGRLLYSFFSTGTKTSLKSVRRNSSMIRKVYVPKYIYPLASSLSSFVTFAMSLIVLVGLMIQQNIKLTWYLCGAVVPMLILLVLTTGVGMVLATCDVFFRDTEYLWDVCLMLIMYLSAIFYKADGIISGGSKLVKTLFRCNPLYAVIVNFRNCIFGQPFDTYYLIYSACIAVVLLLVGMLLFYKKQDKFILYI